MKKYFKALRTVVHANLSGGFECPTCSIFETQAPARMFFIKDKRDNKYKYYIECTHCHRVTPAFEKLADVIDNWEDLFITKECEICRV